MRAQFVLSEIWTGIRRNLSMTVSVVLVMLVSLTFVGLALLMQQQINGLKTFWYDRIQVSIFLCSADSLAPTCPSGEVTDAQRQQVQADLDSDVLAPYVEEYFFETKAEAFERFSDQFSDSAIVDNVTQDQMPESYRVRLVDPEEYEQIAQFFSGREGIESVEDQSPLLERLFAVLNGLTVGALAFAGLMVVAAVMLIGTTIRLSAFNRRREVGIMRMVGASSLFIQLPFLLEGVIAACVGAALATASLWAVLNYGVPWLERQVPLFDYIGTGELLVVAPWLFGIAVVLAGVSSLVSVSRYLRV